MHENLVIEREKGVSFLIGNYEAGSPNLSLLNKSQQTVGLSFYELMKK